MLAVLQIVSQFLIVGLLGTLLWSLTLKPEHKKIRQTDLYEGPNTSTPSPCCFILLKKLTTRFKGPKK